MTRPSTPPILSELRSASSPASQVAALRALKNEVIGHEQKKEMWIGLGVLAPIARILNTHKGSGKRRHRDVHGSRNHSKQRGGRSDEEEARLQAIIIVGSLAYGGPAYVSPIYAGLVISPLLALLSPTESSPQIVLAALSTLNAVADSLLLSHPDHNASDDGLLNLLYTEQTLNIITNILLQISPSLIAQQQIALTASLISKTCRDEHHRVMLAQTGVLGALAVKLASFVVATCNSLNSNLGAGPGAGQVGDIPSANSRSRLLPILNAVSAIIQHSKARAVQFLSAPAFAVIFQKPDADARQSSDRRSSPWNFSTSSTRQTTYSWIENLIPSLPNSHHRSSLAQQSNFPPLGTLGPSGKQSQPSRSFSSAIEVIQSQGLEFIEEEESPLIAWLLYIAREQDQLTGLMAAWTLAILYRHGLTKRGRETAFAFLLVPLLTRMLDKDLMIFPDTSSTYNLDFLTSPRNVIRERAPLVLAMLAANSAEVQKAAADAGAIKKLSQLLKESYDEITPNSAASLWAPDPSSLTQLENRDEASRLGPQGVSVAARHIMRLREAVLVALAAIASDKDEYRKEIIGNGIIPFIIKTLLSEDTDLPSALTAAESQTEHPTKNRKALTVNGRNAILAACGAARALSRSVSTMRTSLMDAGLAAPLFTLLKCQDVELQIAATAVLANLVLSFSPMRQAIIDAGALKIICEHAHSMNTNLRFNSIWALKHLVYEASNDIKKNCLEELGPGWLKQIINNDLDMSISSPLAKFGDRDDGSATPIRMSTPNAVGEQVDLLNAVVEDFRESSQEAEDDGEEDLKMSDSIGDLSRGALDRKQHAFSFGQGNGRGPLLDPTPLTSRTVGHAYQGLPDDLAIQQQGLDFLRNLICGPGATDMIDYVFREVGKDKLFEMLSAKLQPRVLNAFNRDRRSSENGTKSVQPHTEIILSTCYVVVHIATGAPRHRQLVISQTELLRLIIPLFNHPNREIRTCCVWLVSNLTWTDDQSDLINCKARARELMKLGVYEKLEAMDHDEVLDIRERAKSALHSFSQHLRSSG